jgi:hypothetical protein
MSQSSKRSAPGSRTTAPSPSSRRSGVGVDAAAAVLIGGDTHQRQSGGLSGG